MVLDFFVKKIVRCWAMAAASKNVIFGGRICTPLKIASKGRFTAL